LGNPEAKKKREVTKGKIRYANLGKGQKLLRTLREAEQRGVAVVPRLSGLVVF
jgi:hypothetical protein